MFCSLLKTGSTEKLSDSEIEEYLEKTVQLFSYLTDQDMFADIYRNQYVTLFEPHRTQVFCAQCIAFLLFIRFPYFFSSFPKLFLAYVIIAILSFY
jgi:hypothetical protein